MYYYKNRGVESVSDILAREIIRLGALQLKSRDTDKYGDENNSDNRTSWSRGEVQGLTR